MLASVPQPHRSIKDKCIPIAALEPTIRSWFINVFVAEKTPIRMTRWHKRRQMVVLTDAQNRAIHCIINEPDDESLDKFIKPYHVYVVGNAKIKVNTPSVPALTDSDYHIVLTRSSYIRAAEHNEELFPVQRMYALAPFSRCSELTEDAHARINLLCGVIHVFPPRTVRKNNRRIQEFVVVNQERMPMILSLWEEFLQTEAPFLTDHVNEMPVVLGMRLAISTFHGIGLASMPNSTILFDPPMAEAQALQLWLTSNHEYVENVVSQKLYEKQHQVPPQPLHSQLRRISQIISSAHMVRSFWVKARLLINHAWHADEPLYFLICPTCSNTCGSTPGNPFNCFHCGGDFPFPTALFGLKVDLFDSTGKLEVHVGDREARQLLQLEPQDIIDMEETEEGVDIDVLNDNLKERHMFCHVRASASDSQGKPCGRYTLIEFLPMTDFPAATSSSGGHSSSSAAAQLHDSDMLMPEFDGAASTTGSELRETPAPSPQLLTGKRPMELTTTSTVKGAKHAKQD